jgi:hypothetical protein
MVIVKNNLEKKKLKNLKISKVLLREYDDGVTITL